MLAPAALVALILAQVFATRSASLFGRPLWLDEYHTLLLVEDPSFAHAMEALRHGADVNVPGLYVLTRAVTGCVGSTGPSVLRGVALASMLAGLVGLMASIRRVYGPGVAFLAAMAVWAHPVVIGQAFEARFYGPWFAGIVWFAFALNLRDRASGKLGPGLLVGALSVFVCTMHYFGVFSVALVAASHAMFARGRGGRGSPGCCRPRWARWRCRRSTRSTATRRRRCRSRPGYRPRVPRRSSRSSTRFSLPPVPDPRPRPVRVAPDLPKADGGPRGESAGRELAGLGGLALFPGILIAFSFAVQSVMVDRYFIPAIASTAVLIAPILARTTRPARWAVLAGILAYSSARLIYEARDQRKVASSRASMAKVARTIADGPILFQSRKALDELWWDAPEGRDRYFLWSLDDLPDRATDFLRVEQDMAKNHERWYGMAKAATLASVESRPVFYLMGIDPETVRAIGREHPGLAFRLVDAPHRFYEVTRGPTVDDRAGRPGGTPAGGKPAESAMRVRDGSGRLISAL